MRAIVDFQELQEIAKPKVKRDLQIKSVDEQTVKLGVVFNVPLLGDKTIDLDIKVERIDGTDVLLKYDGGTGLNLIANGALELFSSIPFVSKAPENHLIIHLDKIESLRKTLERLELKSVKFDSTSAIVECKYKV